MAVCIKNILNTFPISERMALIRASDSSDSPPGGNSLNMIIKLIHCFQITNEVHKYSMYHLVYWYINKIQLELLLDNV